MENTVNEKIKLLEEDLESQKELNKRIMKQMRKMEYALLEQKKTRLKDQQDTR